MSSNELPRGTVTFLFTDIEGSTKLWQQYPDAMPGALARHHAILNEAIAACGGYVFQIIGDAFCAAFSTATDGLDAALGAQRALRDATWGETGTIRVRMAVHSGAAEVRAGEFTSGEYVSGLTLSRAARLLSAGHGGQILLSLPAAELVRDQLPSDVSLRDLDAHRLKDLIRPEHIYQVVVPDLRSEFLPLKTLDTHANNLPIQLTNFIGREQEMARIKELLEGTRLLTLTGSGGAGKTRLSLQVAADLIDEFPDGVWFIELAPLTDPALIPPTVASILGLHEEAGRPVMAMLSDYLLAKTTLLLLDNCEHLIEACAKFADTVLHAAPKVKILATSREALGIAGETAYRVPSLEIPNPKLQISAEQLSHYDAVRLFVDRALAVKTDFAVTNANAPAVAQICHRLDGIPLAVELAAARVKSLSVEQIAARLNDRFRLLTGGSRTALPRQQTLRAAIDWSHSILTDEERVLLRRLAVFAGGWTLESAQAVCSCDPVCADDVLDLLARLVDKSLVIFEQRDSETRYRLMETIRQYAREKLLDSGEGDQIRARHLDFFIKLVEEAEPKLQGAEVKQWMDRLETEYDNLRAAWEQAIATDDKLALRLALPLLSFWTMHAHLVEGREWLAQLLPYTETWGASIQRAKALFLVGSLDFSQGDYASARKFCEQCLIIARNLGDQSVIENGLRLLGFSYRFLHENEKARPLIEESLALYRSRGEQVNIARLLYYLGSTVTEQGDLVRGQALVEESLAIFRALHNELSIVAPLTMLGEIARAQGDYARAIAIYAETVEIDRKVGNDIHLANALSNLSMAVLQQGDYRRAKELFIESLDWIRRRGARVIYTYWLTGMAGVVDANGKPIQAARLLGAVNVLEESLKSSGSADSLADRLFNQGVLDKVRGRLDQATFEKEFAEGRKMTLEQAIELAMS